MNPSIVQALAADRTAELRQEARRESLAAEARGPRWPFKAFSARQRRRVPVSPASVPAAPARPRAPELGVSW